MTKKSKSATNFTLPRASLRMLFPNIKLILRILLGKHPLIFYTLYSNRIKHPVTRTSALCIEGYMSSANSFLTYMFSYANKLPAGHHQHVPAQIILAKKYSLPIVITIRDPFEMATSFLSRKPWYNLELLLKGYIDFYTSALKETKGNMIVARFDTTVTDPNKVIIAINKHFGTTFNLVDDIETATKGFLSRSSLNTKPSEEREILKIHTRDRVSKAVNLAEAYSIYQKCISLDTTI